MSREIVVSEADKIAVVLENGVVREFYLSEGDQYVGDIILATVESIVPAIEASFLDIGRDKSGFIHVSDLPASKKQQSGIRQFIKPQQQMLVQVTREPTGNKGACLTGFIQLPGRFLVLTPFERRIGLSKKIYDARERARLSRIARMICGSGYGIVLRPEAVGQSEQTLREDLKLLLGRWKHILASSEKQTAGTTLYRDQDILERILREGATSSISRVIVDSQATYERAMKYFDNWSDTKARSKLRVYSGTSPILSNYGIVQQMEKAIQPLVQLPSGGTLVIQQTEALTSIDVNTSSMTSTDNQPETILRTNCEAAEEVARQLVLRDIGGVIVIDFIDMDNPRDQQIVWQKLSDALQYDKSQPQISYFSEFGLVEMTRRRQRQRLSEMLTTPCPTCQGIGRIRNLLYRSDILTGEGMKVRVPVIQVEEKTSRYRSGVEKPVQPPPANNGGRQRSSNPKVRGSAPASAPVETPVKPVPRQTEYLDEPELPETISPPQVNQRNHADEKPEDLLFDESLFDAVTDKVLETYIEREDSLNVSSRLASSLDELLARVDTEGLAVIKRGAESAPSQDNNSVQAYAEEDFSEFKLEDYISEEDGEPDSFEDSELSSSEDLVEETLVAPKAAKGRRPAKGRQRQSAKELPVVHVEPEPEFEPEADFAAPDSDFDAQQAHEDLPEDNVVISSASLAESALTAKASALNKGKPAKRILTKRRTIRSFRPKR